MKNRIITISREFGSGGRTIGKKLPMSLVFRAMITSCYKKLRKKVDSAKITSKTPVSTLRAGFLLLLFLIVVPGRITPIIFGKSSIS